MSRLWRVWGLALLGAVSAARPAAAQGDSVTIPRASAPPTLEHFSHGEPLPLDGRVSEFRQREPRDGEPASRGTTAYLSYDRDNLYVVFVCADNPRGVRARLSKREAIDADDQVAVYLDTFHDRQRAYVFASNPLGIQADAVRTEGQDEDESFDTLWYAEGRVLPFGYVVKMTIPFRSLRFSGAETQVWGIALSRHVRRLNEESYWPVVSKRVQGFVPQFADAQGLTRISPGSNVQVTPYGVFTSARVDGEGASSRRAGADVKVGLGSAFVLDAAVNPDFSEVESDDPQVTVNERFEVFFPERRPFFVENAGFFSTPVNLFFSRRIRDPQAGVRLTGKSGPWVAATLAMRDRETPESDAADVLIGALRYEAGRKAHVGALVTNWQGAAASNRVFSVDGRWALAKTWAVTGQAIRSARRPTGDGAGGGTGYLAEISRNGRHLDLMGRYTAISPEFATDVGFIQRTDVRQVDGELVYQWRPRRGAIVKYGPRVDAFGVWSHGRELLDWRVRPRFEIELIGQTAVLVGRTESFEHYRGLDFRKDRTSFEVETAWTRWLAAALEYEAGLDVNRRPAAGLAPFLGRREATSLTLSWRAGRHLQFDQSYLRTRMTAAGRSTDAEMPVFDNRILRSKLNVQLSRTVSVRTIADYEAVEANRSLSTLRAERRLGLDVLAAVQLNPSTALFVGYVDRFEPLLDEAPSRLVGGYASTGRQLFVKASWLFRY